VTKTNQVITKLIFLQACTSPIKGRCQDFVLIRDQFSHMCCVLNCADGRFLWTCPSSRYCSPL